MEREAFEAAFLEFLREKHGDPTLTVSAHENLFNLGLLDSFALPQLIAYLEGALGRPLGLGRGGLEVFFSIDRAFRACVPEDAQRLNA
jgi:hypothetical protein